MSEYKKKKMRMTRHKRSRKYQHLLDMIPVDESGEGETIIYPNTAKNYMLLCSGVIPRYNKEFAPMEWKFAISDDEKSILIQKMKGM